MCRPNVSRSRRPAIHRSPKDHTMTIVSLHDAQANLPELIHKLNPGQEIVITENSQPVARLVHTVAAPQLKPRQPGTLRGTVLHTATRLDAPLHRLQDYMAL